MRTCTGTFLDSAVGPLNFLSVAVGRNNFKMDRGKVVADAFELVVAMDIADIEASGRIKGDDGAELG